MKHSFLIIFLLSFLLLKGQQVPLPIALENVLELCGANNLTVLEYQKRQQLALANETKAREWWLPEIYAGFSLHQLWGTTMSSEGSFSSGVNRQNLWTGAGMNAYWDFGQGIHRLKASTLKAQAAEYKTQAEKNKALLYAVETYYDFMTAQFSATAYEELAQQTDEIVKQLQVTVDAGLEYETSLLIAKSNYNHIRVKILNAQAAQNSSEAELKRILNLPPVQKLMSIDTVLVPIRLNENVLLDENFEAIYSRRPEIKHIELLSDAISAEKKAITKGMLLPKLQLGVYGALFGGVFKPYAPTAEINAGLQWRIPIGQLIHGGSLREYDAQLAIREAEVQQIKTEVNSEVYEASLNIGVHQEQLRLSEESAALAGEALSQAIQRQQLGTVRPFEILQAQEVYINARLDYLSAIANYNKAEYQLFVAKGNDL